MRVITRLLVAAAVGLFLAVPGSAPHRMAA
jgi:hypothetical protein